MKIKKTATTLNLLCISNAFNDNYFLNNDYVFSKEEFDQLKKEFKKTTKFNYEEFFTNSSIRFKNNPNYIFWKMNAYIDCIKRHKAPNLSGYFDSEQKINSVLSEIDNFLDCSNNGKFDNSEYTLLSKFLYFLKNKNTSTGIDIFNTAISTQNGCILSLFDFNKLITRNIQFKLTSQSNNFVAEIEKNGHQSQLGAINPLDAILNKIQNSIIRQALRDFLNNKPLDQLEKTNLK